MTKEGRELFFFPFDLPRRRRRRSALNLLLSLRVSSLFLRFFPSRFLASISSSPESLPHHLSFSRTSLSSSPSFSTLNHLNKRLRLHDHLRRSFLWRRCRHCCRRQHHLLHRPFDGHRDKPPAGLQNRLHGRRPARRDPDCREVCHEARDGGRQGPSPRGALRLPRPGHPGVEAQSLHVWFRGWGGDLAVPGRIR